MTGAPYLPGFGRCGIPRTLTRWSWTWGFVAVEKAAGAARWNPTSAKTGQIWGTRHLLPVEREAFVPGRERRVREKFRLGSAQLPQQLFPASSQNHRRRAMSLDLAAFDHHHIRRGLEDFRYIMGDVERGDLSLREPCRQLL
jgi:hypothetical protein